MTIAFVVCVHHALAENLLLDSIRDALSTGPSATDVVAFVSGAIFVLSVIVIAAKYYADHSERNTEPTVDYLNVAVDVLGLNEVDRRLLRKIAAGADLRQPAAMLLSPANFSRAVVSLDVTKLDPADRRRVKELSELLYGGKLPASDDQFTKHR